MRAGVSDSERVSMRGNGFLAGWVRYPTDAFRNLRYGGAESHNTRFAPISRKCTNSF